MDVVPAPSGEAALVTAATLLHGCRLMVEASPWVSCLGSIFLQGCSCRIQLFLMAAATGSFPEVAAVRVDPSELQLQG